MQAIINYCIKEKKKRVANISKYLNKKTIQQYLNLSNKKTNFVLIAQRDSKLYPDLEELIKINKSFDPLSQIILIHKNRILLFSKVDSTIKKINHGTKLLINKIIDYNDVDIIPECCICLNEKKYDNTINRSCTTCCCVICSSCYNHYLDNNNNFIPQDKSKTDELVVKCPTCRDIFYVISPDELALRII